MTSLEILSAVIIHLVVPLTGLLLYFLLVRKMKREKVDHPPIVELFLTFATYGGLLLVILTTLFWEWSGIASLGAFYLILGAPIVMGIIAYKNYKNRLLSKYHLWTYKCGIFYFVIPPVAIIMALTFE